LPPFLPAGDFIISRTTFCIACFFFAFAQPAWAGIDYVFIEKIELKGQKKTRPKTILRELDFSVGDTIPLTELPERLERNQQFLMNTGLFTRASIVYKNWEGATNHITLLIEVSENWFIYPFPIFELADRNFNVWWQEYNHAINRINFGVRFYHTNLTGRGDLMKLVTQYGFTQKYELEYTLPTFNKAQSLGIFTNLLYTRNKEIGYATLEDKLRFFRSDTDVLLKRFRVGGGLIHRPNLFFSQRFLVYFHRNQIHESVRQELNPDFFLHGLTQRYFSIQYEATLDRRDIHAYPTKGFLVALLAQKDGLGVFGDLNASYLTAYAKKYFPLGSRFILEQIGKGRFAFNREKQPYYNSIALGYELDFVRGYEFYVMDGLDYFYTKTSLKFNILSWRYDFGKLMPLKPFKVIPVRVYLSLNHDLGYVNNPFYSETNTLANEWLQGYGAGIDFVIYNDKVLQVEYSRNRLGEQGIFLHWEFNF